MNSTYSDKNILWLHHYEECWEPSIKKISGISFDDYTDQICDFILNSSTPTDHVIITRWEDSRVGPEHFVIVSFLDENNISYQFEYVPYGCVEESFLEKDMPSLIPSRKTPGETDPGIKEAVLIESWMLELKSARHVMLAGAFDGECVCDAEDILDHVLGFNNYQRIEGLIVGSGVKYEYERKSIVERDERHSLEEDSFWY